MKIQFPELDLLALLIATSVYHVKLATQETKFGMVGGICWLFCYMPFGHIRLILLKIK